MNMQSARLYLKAVASLILWSFATYYMYQGPDQTATGCVVSWLVILGGVCAYKYLQEMNERYWS